MGVPAETSLGGDARAFPDTRWSILREAGDPESPVRRRALEDFCRIYWKPVYAYIRASRPYGNEEAKDVTQDFLVELLEGGLVERYSREQGNFRTYLKGALRKFVLKERRDATAEKRGGGRKPVELDAAVIDRIDAATPAASDPEAAFDRQWADALLDQAVGEVRALLVGAGREEVFRIFDRHDINPPVEGPPAYADLAAEFGIKETDVTNHLHTCRRMLRERVEAALRELAGDDSSVREELARLFPG